MAQWLPAATEAIAAKVAGLGGQLGAPTGGITHSGISFTQVLERGQVFWHPETGAVVLYGAILDRYRELGGPEGVLGYPLNDETGAADGAGRFNRFEHGAVYWHPEIGAREVYGAIFGKWDELGREAGALGYPMTGELGTPDGIGRYNHFQHGSIYFTPSTGAHAVLGKLRDRWASIGWERSYLGYPTADTRSNMSRFQRGTIHEDLASGGTYEVADTRDVHIGTIHVDGAAANGWAQLTISSNGLWRYSGAIRATGAVSYDVAIATTPKVQDARGRTLSFAETGDVEGTLVLGGNREHTWDHKGSDEFVRDNWDALRDCDFTTVLKVDFGVGDVLAVAASILGIPVAVIALAAGGAWMDANTKWCGYTGHEYYNPGTNQWERENGAVMVGKDDPCPPGTFQDPPHQR
jgi:hypothetical protein